MWPRQLHRVLRGKRNLFRQRQHHSGVRRLGRLLYRVLAGSGVQQRPLHGGLHSSVQREELRERWMRGIVWVVQRESDLQCVRAVHHRLHALVRGSGVWLRRMWRDLRILYGRERVLGG
jgi:hypothetical protein